MIVHLPFQTCLHWYIGLYVTDGLLSVHGGIRNYLNGNLFKKNCYFFDSGTNPYVVAYRNKAVTVPFQP